MKAYPTGKPPEAVALTGALFPWIDGAPFFMRIGDDTETLYLPVFTAAGDLRGAMDRCGIVGYRIKEITDGPEFLSSFDEHPEIAVILNVRITPEGKTRFQQVLR